MSETNEFRIQEVEGIAPLLQVYDMPASLQFYRDKLGFTVTGSSGDGDDVDWVMLGMNNSILMLNTTHEKHNRPSEPDAIRNKWHHDTILYFNYPDIDGLYHHLLSKGIQPGKPFITGYSWKAIYFTDPDNYQLCFHWPVV